MFIRGGHHDHTPHNGFSFESVSVSVTFFVASLLQLLLHPLLCLLRLAASVDSKSLLCQRFRLQMFDLCLRYNPVLIFAIKANFSKCIAFQLSCVWNTGLHNLKMCVFPLSSLSLTNFVNEDF